MTWNYNLQPNRLDLEALDYLVKIHPNAVYDLDGFVHEMVSYHSSFTEADFHGMIKVQTAQAVKLIQAGCNINTPLVNIRPRLRGRVGVNGASHPALELGVSVSAGPALRAAIMGVDLFRLPTFSAERPAPLFFVDDHTHAVNKIATIGGRGQLLGERMRFDPSDPNQGVFLIDLENAAALQIETAGAIEPASMTLILPAGLVAGKTYAFEVRAVLTPSGELRSGRLVFTVTAQDPAS